LAASELLPLIDAVGRVLLGKERQVRLAFSCLLAGGQLLIEDRPGMGKSILAEALAQAFALAFKRVSFTSDLLPADLTGLNVFNPAGASSVFSPARCSRRCCCRRGSPCQPMPIGGSWCMSSSTAAAGSTAILLILGVGRL
jgi:hypothetical protein